MNTRLDLQLRQKLVMTPQLQQAIRLLQLSRMELTQEIQQQMLENPLIEEGTADTPDEESPLASSEGESSPSASEEASSESADLNAELTWERYGNEEEWDRGESRMTWEAPEERPSYEATLTRPVSLSDHLLWQLGVADLSDPERAIGEVIIGDLNEDGYLESTLEELVDETAASRGLVESVLQRVQGFDPPGVGGRNLVECLLIQVRLLGISNSLIARLIQDHLAALEKRQYTAIAKACQVSMEEVLQAAKIIERLEPKPGRPFASSENNFNIVPEVFVMKAEETALNPSRDEEGSPNGSTRERYAVILNDEGLPRAKISAYYRSILKLQGGGGTEETRAYLEEKFRSAVWFIRSLEQRNRTILKVVESIVRFQEGFMEHGVRLLKPLVLKQVAEDIEMHESTISRVTTHKYIHTPQGIYPLKFFFNSALASTDDARSETVSSLAVRERIGQMVAAEDSDHPLTDAKIVAQLKREHVDVARRTVSKYRAELNIAAASRRRRPH